MTDPMDGCRTQIENLARRYRHERDEALIGMTLAREVACTLWTALDLLRQRGLDPSVQELFDQVDENRPSWLRVQPHLHNLTG